MNQGTFAKRSWFVFLLSAQVLLPSCRNSCDRLSDRAAACDFATGRPVDDTRSSCLALRRDVGGQTFDELAQCVDEFACEAQDAAPKCTEEIFGPEAEVCLRLRIWGSVCDLNPVGTDEECNTLLQSMGEVSFSQWVECLEGGGCPTEESNHYDECSEVFVSESTTDLIDACVELSAWREECQPFWSEGGGVTFPGSNFASCLAEAQVFTVTSFKQYSDCLSGSECDGLSRQLECISMLRLVDGQDIEEPCQDLIDYAEDCDLNLGGGSLDACTRIFRSFSKASFVAYVECLESYPCEETSAAAVCAPLLELQ